MGKQKGLYLQGKTDNILYYKYRDIPSERMIPADVYQSPAVVAHKNANGLATTMGGAFRRSLANVIPYPQSMQMQTAVRLALLKWLKQGPAPSVPPQNIPFISKLSFNEEAILKSCMRVPLTLTATPTSVTLHLPQIIPLTDFTAPAETEYIGLKIAAASCDIKTGVAIDNYSHRISIPYDAVNIPAQNISLPLQMPADSLTMVAVALDYYTIINGRASLIMNEHYRPSEVIGGVMSVG